MNEAQVRTLEQVRQVLDGTDSVEFRRAEDDEGRYGWIESVLRRFDYRQLARPERGPVLAYLQRLSGLQPRPDHATGLALDGRQAAGQAIPRTGARLRAALHGCRRGLAGRG